MRRNPLAQRKASDRVADAFRQVGDLIVLVSTIAHVAARRSTAASVGLQNYWRSEQPRNWLALESKFAAMISYGLTAKLLAEVLPTGGNINVAGVYRNLQRVAERMEAELGEEKWQFIDGCQRDWDALPPPGPPLTVGLDGGFIHAKDQKSRGEGWFEVRACLCLRANLRHKAEAAVVRTDEIHKGFRQTSR